MIPIWFRLLVPGMIVVSVLFWIYFILANAEKLARVIAP